MIPLILRLLSFLFEDDTKLNPYAGEDGECRAACPSSSDHCLLDPPEEGVQLSLGLFAFIPTAAGVSQASCWVGRQRGFWAGPLDGRSLCLPPGISHLSQERPAVLLPASLLWNIHRPERSKRRREGLC